MRFTGVLALALACAPVAIMAAPTGLTDSPGAPSSSPAAMPPTTQSSNMVNGGQDGLLDKIEQILKEALGSLRKRGLVAELGDQVDKLLEEVAVLLNGQKGSSQGSFSQGPSASPQGQGNGGDSAATPAAPTSPTPPPPQPQSDSSSSKGSSPLSSLLGGGKRDVLRRRGGSLLDTVTGELPAPVGGGSTPTPSSQATPLSSGTSYAPAGSSSPSSSSQNQLSPAELSQLVAALQGSSSSGYPSDKKGHKIPTQN